MVKQRPPERRQWLRVLAFGLGLAVLIGHIFTTKPLIGTVGTWEVSLKDLAYHFSFVAAFTLAYRLSFIGSPPGSNRATILVCSGWAGLCEIMQRWIPARDFSIIEFGVNTLTPVLIAGLVTWVIGRRD